MPQLLAALAPVQSCLPGMGTQPPSPLPAAFPSPPWAATAAIPHPSGCGITRDGGRACRPRTPQEPFPPQAGSARAHSMGNSSGASLSLTLSQVPSVSWSKVTVPLGITHHPRWLGWRAVGRKVPGLTSLPPARAPHDEFPRCQSGSILTPQESWYPESTT